MVIKGVQIGGLYKLMDETQVGEAVVSSAKIVFSMVWHQCLGYMSECGLQLLSNMELLPRYKSVPLKFCEDCIYSKQRRISFSFS